MFWGFLDDGTIGTSDGGRGWRRALIDLLAGRGHRVVFLQMDRDLLETGVDFGAAYRWDVGRPELDALVLEWRWPVPGRNTSMCGRPGHDCDLHRQQALLADYTDRGMPTIVWDPHRRLPASDPLRRHPHVVVCEPSATPTPGAVTLY